MGYREIAERIRRQIAAETLKPGDYAPSLREVIRWGHGSQSAAQRAYAVLATEGVLVREHGTGHRVAEGAVEAVRSGSSRLDTRTADQRQAETDARLTDHERRIQEIERRLR